MKSSKSTKVKPAKEEECGIWLDTNELKEKKQQKQTRPISRYSVSAALSFTQTKLNMPVTRQSSISSFFTPKSADPNRSATHTGTKRKHHMTIESSSQTPEEHLQNWDGDWEGSSDKDEKEQRFFHLICGEEEEPPEKRRHVAHHTDQNVLETQECWNKEEYANQTVQTFLHGASQEASPSPKNEDKHVQRDQNLTVLTSRPVNEHHRRSSTIAWRKTKASPMKRMGKENICPASPIQNTPSSPFKRRLMSSPAKCRLKERHTLSPVKHASAETAGETLASLFTQDSEGLCVIAHRDRRPSSEGKSQSDEEEMLFTQDSEGNMVIKH